MTGAATVAQYEQVLKTATYNNSSNTPDTTDRLVEFTVNDGQADSATATSTVAVAVADDPPAAVDDSASVLEDAAATAIDVLANDTDIDGGPKTISSASDPANGTVALTGGSSGAHTGLTYQPDADYCNDPPATDLDTFTYTLNGGSEGTVSMKVTCVNDNPVADDETFNGADGAIGNTALVVNDPSDGAPSVSGPKKSISGDILDGDTDVDGPNQLAIQAGTFATNDGGSVTIESDGDFTYVNDPADSCTDTSDFFDYTVTDGNSPTAGTDTGRVNVSISGCVWYVSNNASGNSGTSTAPFDTLAQAETASSSNHTIFVFDVDNTSSGYTAGINLKANQKLIGEAANLVVGSDTLHTGDSSKRPTLTDNNDDVVALANANEVRGLELNPQGTGGGIAGGSGDTGGTIDDVQIIDTGTAGTQPGLELDTTTGTFNVSNLTVDNSAATGMTSGSIGVRLNNAGTVNFASTGTISITSSGAKGLDASGTTTNMGSGSVFDDITVTGSGSGGVSMSGTTGTTTFGDGSGTDLSLTTTSGTTPAFSLSNAGTVTVPSGGTANVSATGGPAIDVTGTSGASLAFDDVDSTNSSTAGGASGDGINLDGLVGGSFSAASGDIGGAAGIAFDLNGGSGAITYPGNLGNGTGATAEITGRSPGPSSTVTLSGQIADNNDAGGGISMSGNTGGSTTFSGTSKVLNTGSATAFSSTGSGHTISFTNGGLDIDTTSGTGFSATGGGTILVGTGANPNTIDSTTGTALNVANTTIGSNGLTFRMISAGTGVGSAGNGIVLDTTGNLGGLTVTGSGTAGSGGTIQHKTGADGSTTSGIGIYLNNTARVSLTNMQLNDFDNFGIYGTTVNGFSLSNSTINGSIGTSSGSADAPIAFGKVNPSGINGLSGTANSVTDTTISGGIEHNFEIYSQSGSFTLNVTRATIRDNSAALGSDGLLTEMQGTAAGTIVVDDSDFINNKSQAMQGNALDSSSLDVTVNNSDITRTTQGNEGVIFQNASNGDLTAKITNNRVTDIPGTGIFVGEVAGNATAASQLTATIQGNTVDSTTGAPANRPIIAFLSSTSGATSQAHATLLIDNNDVTFDGGSEAIFVSTPDSNTAPDIDATVTNNTVDMTDSVTALCGLAVQATQGVAGQGATMCARIAGNDVSYPNGTPAGVNGLRARQANPGGGATNPTFQLEQGSSGSNIPSTVLAANNPLSTTEVFGTLSVVPNSTCQTVP